MGKLVTSGNRSAVKQKRRPETAAADQKGRQGMKGNVKRFLSHRGHVIYYNEFGFMVAKGDGTDEYFATWEKALLFIDEIEDAKQDQKGAKHGI